MSTSRKSELVEIPLDRLVPHPLNPNVMPDELRKRLAEHVRRSGRYPPLIVRSIEGHDHQIMDGHQRASVLRDLGERSALCLVWDVPDDTEAALLVATLNRLRGEDNPGRRALLLQELAQHRTQEELALLLPESESELNSLLGSFDFDVDKLLERVTAAAEEAAAVGPQLFSFAVDPADAPIVEEAIDAAAQWLGGSNRRGRALVAFARTYLDRGVGR